MKLILAANNSGAFSCMPAREVELDDKCILCNDIGFPWEYNNTCFWVVGNEFGALGAAWGNEGDVLDELADVGLLVSCAVEEDAEHLSYLGNASESYDLTNVWVQRVDVAKLAVADLCKLAECRGAGQTTVYA